MKDFVLTRLQERAWRSSATPCTSAATRSAAPPPTACARSWVRAGAQQAAAERGCAGRHMHALFCGWLRLPGLGGGVVPLLSAALQPPTAVLLLCLLIHSFPACRRPEQGPLVCGDPGQGAAARVHGRPRRRRALCLGQRRAPGDALSAAEAGGEAGGLEGGWERGWLAAGWLAVAAS